MKRKWFLVLVILSTILCACGTNEYEQNNEKESEATVTPTAMPTTTPVIIVPSELQYISFSEMPDEGKTISSLLNDEECEYSLCTEQDDIVIAILAEKKMEILSDASVNGEESFYIVFYNKKDGKIIFKEKKVAEQGFQIVCAQEENRAYVIVLSRNDYCDVEYYDMSVYRMENGCVQEGMIANDINALQWWQEYKPVLNANGAVELYLRKAAINNFTYELMKETALLAWDKVSSKSTEYAEKFCYTWEYSHSINITDIDYVSNQTVLTQSSVLSDVVEECLKPHQNAPSGTGDTLCGIVCGTVNAKDGYYLMVCKRLGRSRAQGIGHIGIILYNSQGDIVDTDYYGSDEVSIMCEESKIAVFARYNQQGWVKIVLDGIIFAEDGKIYYQPMK